jgi:hypothetical protein
MSRKNLIAPLLAASAMALTVTPAHAGKADRARQAIAAAEAKIQTAVTLGASTGLPRETAEARATLARAKERLERGDKAESIDEAIRAQAMADTAIGVMQRRKDEQLAGATAAREADVAVAQQQVDEARRQAEQANLRAASAQQQAATSAAEASAARTAAVVAAQNPPAQVDTTVTTQQQPARTATRQPVRKTTTTTRRTTAPPAVTTTTTVRQSAN